MYVKYLPGLGMGQQIFNLFRLFIGLDVGSDFFVENFALTINPKKWLGPILRDACGVIAKVPAMLAETQNA